jgi:hypothetical protein
MCGVSGVCRKAAPCGRLTRRADSAWPICAICPSGQIGSDLISELGLNEKRARASVIASGAKQSISPCKERMECFVALLLAMTWITIEVERHGSRCTPRPFVEA